MAQALRVKQNIYRLSIDDPVQASEAQVLHMSGTNALGMVVNVAQRHWIAIRAFEGELWLLDSGDKPSLLTLNDVVGYVRAHCHAFLVEVLDH